MVSFLYVVQNRVEALVGYTSASWRGPLGDPFTRFATAARRYTPTFPHRCVDQSSPLGRQSPWGRNKIEGSPSPPKGLGVLCPVWSEKVGRGSVWTASLITGTGLWCHSCGANMSGTSKICSAGSAVLQRAERAFLFFFSFRFCFFFLPRCFPFFEATLEERLNHATLIPTLGSRRR